MNGVTWHKERENDKHHLTGRNLKPDITITKSHLAAIITEEKT